MALIILSTNLGPQVLKVKNNGLEQFPDVFVNLHLKRNIIFVTNSSLKNNTTVISIQWKTNCVNFYASIIHFYAGPIAVGYK